MISVLFLVGLFATMLGTLAGSGGLINFPAMLLLGVPVHSTIAANKFSNTLSSFSSFFTLFLQKKIPLRLALKTGPFSLIGGIGGGIFASHIEEQSMLIIAIFLLIGALIITFVKKEAVHSLSKREFPAKGLPFLTGIGWYDGMFGPGQATFQLHLFRHYNMDYLCSIALTRFNTFLSCIGAMVTYILSGHMVWSVAIPLALGSITGAQIGVRLAAKLSTIHVKWILRIITFTLVIQLTYRFFNQL
ncbi:sulfite exporter TauE/SafE family protein [Pseudalkalibacillus caeni]|uniref:Probable membrane transporter protein n=1 Tax=Exobacillus caeni TaxID=2574798 RepID=A0A5R9F6K2_9BACL|nr:sulfite exporter TauE/SafE family protein [Pseudalkalibacillus caeni]TLS37976.1 sulfite exporter TauE/SafE family protein [Pseudalkalibacillus caeni]